MDQNRYGRNIVPGCPGVDDRGRDEEVDGPATQEHRHRNQSNDLHQLTNERAKYGSQQQRQGSNDGVGLLLRPADEHEEDRREGVCRRSQYHQDQEYAVGRYVAAPIRANTPDYIIHGSNLFHRLHYTAACTDFTS